MFTAPPKQLAAENARMEAYLEGFPKKVQERLDAITPNTKMDYTDVHMDFTRDPDMVESTSSLQGDYQVIGAAGKDFIVVFRFTSVVKLARFNDVKNTFKEMDLDELLKVMMSDKELFDQHTQAENLLVELDILIRRTPRQ